MLFKLKNKPRENVCSICFEDKRLVFLHIASILQDAEIVKSRPTSSIEFWMSVVTYKLFLPLFTPPFNFNKFVCDLYLDVSLTNPDILILLLLKDTTNTYYSQYTWIIKNNVLRKIYTKRRKQREVWPIDLEETKSCLLKGINNCIWKWCNKNGIDESFFSKWSNNVTNKIDERITRFENNWYTYKYLNCLSSTELKKYIK